MRVVVKRRRGAGSADDLHAVIEELGVEVIDRVDDDAALVEASDQMVARLKERLPHYSIAPETGVARPSPPYPRREW